MKIAWFTPFSTRSAIGRIGDLAAHELSSQAEVHIWHNDFEDVRETEIQTVAFSSAAGIDSGSLAAYDAIVYNFGHHFRFHKEIFDISRRAPGICILHDFVFHDFFVHYYLEERKDPASYSDVMGRWYGERGRRVAADSLKTSPRVWETDAVADYPLFEEVIHGARGVVTHSEFLHKKVRAVFPGPVTKLYLPNNVIAPERALTRADIDVPDDKILIVTVGHVNPNKRIHAVIEALAKCGNTDRIIYAVVGSQHLHQRYRHRLASCARKFGLESVVRFPGYVSEDLLEAYLAHADICVNLGFPAIKGASAAIVEGMLHGKPVIVTDCDLPHGCVHKVRPGHEMADLAACLSKLMVDPEARLKTGRLAKQFAETHCTPAKYARELLRFLREAPSAKPQKLKSAIRRLVNGARLLERGKSRVSIPATAHGSPEILVCLRCNGSLREERDSLRCVACGRGYPVVLGVPLMVEGMQVGRSSHRLSGQICSEFYAKYRIEPNEDDFHLLDQVLSHSYRFRDDPALDAENNYLLNRVELAHYSERRPLASTSNGYSGRPRYSIVRHYIPAELPAGTQMSSSIRLRNTGDEPIHSESYVLACEWLTQPHTVGPAAERVSRFPVSLFPGRELTVPLFFSTPIQSGSYTLVVGLRGAGENSELIEPLKIALTIGEQGGASDAQAPLLAGPKLPDYDEDHREAIRILEHMVESHLSFQGLEIAGSSTPSTTNLPCDIVNADIDVQALQVGRHVLERRGHLNVRFVCCNSHALPFAPASFDFAAIFAALHHFRDPAAVLRSAARVVRPEGFIAVMCEPVGHYQEQPDGEMQGQLEFGINEQRFSLDEYRRMFDQANLEPVSTQVDADSLKTILKPRSK